MKKYFDVLREMGKKYYHLVIFAVFFLLEAYSISWVTVTGDDYYYANFIPKGLEYFFSENVAHYMETNGRAFIHILDEIFLALPLTVWKLLELLAVAAIVFLCAALAAGDIRDQKKFPPALVMSCVMFSVIDLYIMRETVLWVTGSFNYVLPLLLTLVLFRVFTNLASKEKGAWYLPVLAFFAAFTTEQSATAAVLICLFVIAKTALVEKKKIRVSHIITIPVSIAALATILLAPGNAVRETYYPEFYAKPLVERVSDNFVTYFKAACEAQGMLFFFTVMFLLAAFSALAKVSAMGSDEVKEKGGMVNLLFHVLIFVFAFITAITLVMYSSVFPRVYIRTSMAAGLVLITTVLIIAELAARFISGEDDGVSLICAVCAVVTFGAMVFGPIYGSRVFFVPIILMFVPIIRMAYSAFDVKFAKVFIPFAVTCYGAYLFSTRAIAFVVLAYFVFLLELVSKSLRKVRPSSVLAVGAAFMVILSIGMGYSKNADVNWYNSVATEKYVAAGDFSEPLVLSYPRAMDYTYSLPYSNTYHLNRYKELHGIPAEARIVHTTPEAVGLE